MRGRPGQWGRPEPAVSRRRYSEAGCRGRVSDAGRVSDLSVADLPEHSLRHPDLARNRAADRDCSTSLPAYRDRGTNRAGCAALLPRTKNILHDELHDPVPEYVSARLPVPLSWSYALLRRF